ncbi:DUF1761 domain-containing protein [Xanthocytophaga agilis]|uniref:DUF1761 domain-containing protein n=1 Tax=Xanthocytophaga agilis TaxID=3048010 RepID=A0AAE3RC68_9BACT|nr:DUF1761 domain-containing protein [Xanthocytophaga agilis]MDJ1505660.1 DUF1761 domain-containing protein [Xanthocytophaga agilis]
MLHVLTDISWLSVLLAFIIYFILGSLWFTVFFPKLYKISLGKENDTTQSTDPIFFVGPALCCLVITIASALLVYALHIETYQSAFQFAVIVGVGYLFSNTVNIAINPNIPRPILYGLISGSYHLVGIIIVSLILLVMK